MNRTDYFMCVVVLGFVTVGAWLAFDNQRLKTENSYVSHENRILHDQILDLQQDVVSVLSKGTYQQGFAAAMVAGKDAKYVAGYHQAKADEGEWDSSMIVESDEPYAFPLDNATPLPASFVKPELSLPNE